MLQSVSEGEHEDGTFQGKRKKKKEVAPAAWKVKMATAKKNRKSGVKEKKKEKAPLA